MVYLNNTDMAQEAYIPRQSALTETKKTDFATVDYVDEALENYTPTTGFATINGNSITEGGNITIEGTDYEGGDNIEVSGNVISVTGIPTEFKTINGSAITGNGDITIEGKVYSAGTNINIDSADTISVTGIPTEFKTINGSAITGNGDITIEGKVYSAGTNIEIDSANTISVTGITVPTKVSDLENDEHFATTGWVESQHYLTEHQSLSAYSTTNEVESMVSAATAATTGWVESQGYLKEHQSLSAYTPTSGFSTINGSAITSGGNITISASSTVELTQAEYDALPVKQEGVIYVITDAAPLDIDDLASQRLAELDSAPSGSTDGDVINLEDGLYKYVDGSGQTGFWTADRDNAVSANSAARGFALSFSHIPDGQQILEFRRNNNGNWKQFKMENGVLNVYDNSGSTPSTAITKNGGVVRVVSLSNSSYWIEVDYRDNYIGFYKNDSTQVQNLWDGITSTAHYEKISIPEPLPFINADYYGIPYWNKRGEVISRKTAIESKSMYFNTTGSSSSYRWDLFYGGAGNTPARMFVPTQAGTQGQVLTSAGNAEPTWQTIIKAVKITSDEYEALAVKDPNTLYLIIDE